MPPSPKDRQNSGISMREKERAAAFLNRAIKDAYANVGPSPVLMGIRTAMAILDMDEEVFG